VSDRSKYRTSTGTATGRRAETDTCSTYVRVRRCDVCTPSAVSAVPALSDSRTSLHCTHTDARLGAPAISLSRSPAHAAPAALSSPPPAPSSSSLILINSTPAADMPRGCRSRFWGAAGRVPRPHPTCPLIVHMLRRGRAPRPASDRKRQAPRGDRKQLYVPTADATDSNASCRVRGFFFSCHCPILTL
jgi:hypothetical protein